MSHIINNDQNEYLINYLKKCPYNSNDINEFLNENKAHLDFMDQMGIGSYIFDYKSRSYFYVSNSILEVFEVSKDQLLSSGLQSFFNGIEKSDLERILYLISESLAFINKLPENQRSKVSMCMYYRLKKDQGKGRWIMHKNRIFKYKNNSWINLGFTYHLMNSEAQHPTYCMINYGDQSKCIFPSDHIENSNQTGLSNKEQEVFYWTKRGLSVKLIAKQLLITESGVRFHRRNILKKLGRKNFIGI